MKRLMPMILIAAAILFMASPAYSSSVAMRVFLPPYSIPQFVYPQDYSGAWLPNSDDIFAIELTPEFYPQGFYLYDWGNPDNNLLLFNDGISSAATVNFYQKDNDWIASTVRSGITYIINLGEDQFFGFFFGSGDDPLLNYEFILDSSDSYVLMGDLANRMIVSVSDVSPVPLPGTLWLLGSGLAGLVAIRRQKK